MPNFCTKVMQHVLKQRSEISPDWIFKIMLGKDLGHIYLLEKKCIVSFIIYHEKYHFLLELFSNIFEESGWTKGYSISCIWDPEGGEEAQNKMCGEGSVTKMKHGGRGVLGKNIPNQSICRGQKWPQDPRNPFTLHSSKILTIQQGDSYLV